MAPNHTHTCSLAVFSRGYGFSEGTPGEPGLVVDAEAAYAWLMEQAERGLIDSSKIVICGRSLGGSVAIHLAHELARTAPKYPPCSLIVENSFTSISDVVDEKFPFLNIPFFKQLFLRLHWRSIDVIPQIKLPILFLASIQDEIVPYAHMRELKQAATGASSAEIHSFNATHNDIWVAGGDKYWQVKKTFVQATCVRGL